jgi:hypothetical protein
MHFPINTTGDEAAWRAVLGKVRAAINGVLVNNLTCCRLNDDGGERLCGGIKTDKHRPEDFHAFIRFPARIWMIAIFRVEQFFQWVAAATVDRGHKKQKRAAAFATALEWF